MKTMLKKISFISMTLAASLATAQPSTEELLEQLQVESNTPIMELNVEQLITLIQQAPLALPVCADFSAYGTGFTFYPYTSTSVGSFTFNINYTGGARISHHGSAPGVQLLEMVEDGSLEIVLSSAADDVTLELIQAANQANAIEYYDNNGMLLGTTYTSYYDVLDTIHLSGTNIKRISISNPELFLQEICYF